MKRNEKYISKVSIHTYIKSRWTCKETVILILHTGPLNRILALLGHSVTSVTFHVRSSWFCPWRKGWWSSVTRWRRSETASWTSRLMWRLCREGPMSRWGKGDERHDENYCCALMAFYSRQDQIYGGRRTAEHCKGPGDCLTEGRVGQAVAAVSRGAQNQERPPRQHQGGGDYSTENRAGPNAQEDCEDSTPLRESILFFFF